MIKRVVTRSRSLDPSLALSTNSGTAKQTTPTSPEELSSRANTVLGLSRPEDDSILLRIGTSARNRLAAIWVGKDFYSLGSLDSV